jgi:hypothetical protein
MTTFVLVPGAWKGAWAFEAVVPLLERAGHTVHALTLTGLRPDDDNATVATADLDTHADDVLAHDGDSWWSLTNEYFRDLFAAGAAATGYAVRPPDGGDPRRRPHPLASVMQTIRLTGGFARVPRREFVYCSGWEDQTPFADLRTRLEADPDWHVHELPTAHNAMREDPEAVAALLLDDRVEAAGVGQTRCWSSPSPRSRSSSSPGRASCCSWPAASPTADAPRCSPHSAWRPAPLCTSRRPRRG